MNSLIPILFFFIGVTSWAQTPRPQMHLMLAADITESQNGVKAIGKIDKVNLSYELIAKSLDYEIVYYQWYDKRFDKKTLNSDLSTFKVQGPNDIIVFYYIGFGNQSLANGADLLFRENKKGINTKAISDILSKKQARLALVITDLFPKKVLTREFSLTDSIPEVKVVQSQIPVKEPVDFSKTLSTAALDSFIETKNKLISNFTALGSEKNRMLLARVSSYPSVGFPADMKTIKKRFRILPDMEILRSSPNRNFDCVIDSLYKLGLIFDEGAALHAYLNKLIAFPNETGTERPIFNAEKLDALVIRQLFLGACGQFSFSNKAELTVDYTNNIFKGLNTLVAYPETSKVTKLRIDSLFVPKPLGTAFKTINKQSACPAVDSSSFFYLPITVPNITKIQEDINAFLLEKDLVKQKLLVISLTNNFEKKSKIEVVSKGAKLPFANISLALEYLHKAKASSITIPNSGIIRSPNFSKIIELRIIQM